MCAIHNKTRHASAVVDIGNGRHQCRPGSQCKVSGSHGPRTEAPAPTYHRESGSSDRREVAATEAVVMCSVHNQRRSPKDLFMQQSQFGLVYVCNPNSQCRGMHSAPPAVSYMPYQSHTSLAALGTPRGPLQATPSPQRQMCGIHKKPRLLRYLELENGEYRCHRDHECDMTHGGDELTLNVANNVSSSGGTYPPASSPQA